MSSRELSENAHKKDLTNPMKDAEKTITYPKRIKTPSEAFKSLHLYLPITHSIR